MSPRRPSPTALVAIAAVLTLAAFVEGRLVTDWWNARWILVWHDEFDGAAHSSPDISKWAYDIGDGGSNPGWGNYELQSYTSSPDNVYLNGNGCLVIRALEAPDGYTSGRLKTKGKFEFMYGKVEARIRIPYAQGIWPAFWMLGSTFPDTPWPAAGEIDIMENFGPANADARRNHATVHGPGYSGTGITAIYTSSSTETIADTFHVFAVEWSKNRLEFFVDGQSFHTVARGDIPPGTAWVFNEPFFLLLNVAVGGSPAPVGYPDSSTQFPKDMLVDYVRVYKRAKDEP